MHIHLHCYSIILMKELEEISWFIYMICKIISVLIIVLQWGTIKFYILVLTSRVFFSSVEKGQVETIEAESLTRELLDTNRCYVLDCGTKVFVWMGRNTSLEERRAASVSIDVILVALVAWGFQSCFFHPYSSLLFYTLLHYIGITTQPW